ncbi:MAG TPA: class I SAM-dependent methyltransferase [Chitinophagaceae bacterium]|nr:class I SAM-dependent methyltransferase [Chitinophagaceae bacterium]
MSQSDFWNQRYALPEYAYGKEPNEFFKQQLSTRTPGKILLAAEGEGRNAVYAASLGWDVTAFDISSEGQAKALQLANEHHVSIQYHVGTLDEINLDQHSFDVIGFCFAHMPSDIRTAWHRQCMNFLAPGGEVILQGFSKAHQTYQQKNPHAGGPKDISMLFSKEELMYDFEDLQIDLLEEEICHLTEGAYHQGESALMSLVAHKRN